MPIIHRIDADAGVVHITADGVLTDAELFELRARLAADPALRPGMPRLADVRSVGRLEVTPEGIRHLAAMDRSPDERFAHRRIAIVASGALAYGMARMYEAMNTDGTADARVFRDMDEARAWLGLE